MSLKYESLTGKIIGAAMETHRQIGPGQDENLYEEALALLLEKAGLMVRTQLPLPVRYKTVKLDCGYRLDVAIEGQVVVEAKAVDAVLPVHLAQLMSYQRLGQFPVGLLLNFNEAHLREGIHRRIVDSTSPNAWNPSVLTTEERRTRRLDLEDASVTENLISAISTVQAELGPGLLLSAYSACFQFELDLREIRYEMSQEVAIMVAGRTLRHRGVIPMIAAGVPILMLTTDALRPAHDARLLATLRLGQYPIGLLINFNATSAKMGIRRIINPDRHSKVPL